MAADGGTRAVVAALLANTGIALTKFLAFFLTGVSSMLAEAIHSVADAGNQMLLLIGGKQARKEATEEHPFGYGRERYIYSFIVAIVLFSVGGLFALYEAYHKYHEIHDAHGHFAQARRLRNDPPDQIGIPRPRLGFFGVIDERMDLDLIDGIAATRPDWHLVLLGPVVKIDPESLPRRPNLHYLGARHYQQLPDYLAGWDVALMPFARNDATRFISPTKTPEYMAAGVPVVSTSIRDVVRPYGQQGLVRIADEVPAFVQACADAMAENRSKRITQADAFLRQTSWDGTWNRIRLLLDEVLHRPHTRARERAGAGIAAI